MLLATVISAKTCKDLEASFPPKFMVIVYFLLNGHLLEVFIQQSHTTFFLKYEADLEPEGEQRFNLKACKVQERLTCMIIMHGFSSRL